MHVCELIFLLLDEVSSGLGLDKGMIVWELMTSSVSGGELTS